MTEGDWVAAWTSAKAKNREFPNFERRACKAFMLVGEDNEAEVMQHVTAKVQEYLNRFNREVSPFVLNRLMTYIVSLLGK